MQAHCNIICFPRKSKPAPKKKNPKQKATALEWIRGGFVFPGQPLPPSPKKEGGK